MEGKYLYFRTTATIADDDNKIDSACWPASSLTGMHPTSDTLLTLYFKSIARGSGNLGYDAGENNTPLENRDYVSVTVPANTHAIAMKAITGAISGSNFPSFIVVADDRTGVTEYLAGSGITACGGIVIQELMVWAAGICCAEG